jgi:hypothetical protein
MSGTARRRSSYKITRVAAIEKRIAFGQELVKLKAGSRRNDDYGQLRLEHFPDHELQLSTEAAGVASMCGGRLEIYRRLSWPALIMRSSPSLPVRRREQFERRILAGEDVNGPNISRRPLDVAERAAEGVADGGNKVVF